MKRLIVLALLFVASAACTVELSEFQTPTNAEDYADVLITAEQVSEEGTKTVRGADKAIYWLPGDEINVFCGNDRAKFTSTNTEPARIASFSGQLLLSTVAGATGSNETDAPVWGLYPYDANAESDGAYVTTTLPHEQTGTAGSFADKQFLTLACAQSFILRFYSVCSGFKFTLNRDDISSISFRGNNNEDLAGKVKLSFTEGRPSVSVLEGQKVLTLTPEHACFQKNVDYYVIMLPCLLSNGFTMTFEASEGTGDFCYDKSIAFERNIIVNKNHVDQDVQFGTVCLSDHCTSNCYIVSRKGSYSFEATKGTSYERISGIKGVKVLWESFGTSEVPEIGDLIKPGVGYEDGYITFETGDSFKEGNALIAAYSDAACSDGNVLWSWHIWLTDMPAEQIYANNAGTVMDRNLGATSATPGEVEAYGLFYQWGRKDPFLGSATHPVSSTVAASTITWPDYVRSDANCGTVDYATKHPTVYIYKGADSGHDWHIDNKGKTQESSGRWLGVDGNKPIDDPCPAGWRVPSISLWKSAGFPDYMDTPGYKNADYDTENLGVTFPASICGNESWFPATGAFYMSTSINQFRNTFLWSSNSYEDWGRSYYYYYEYNTATALTAWGTFEKYNLMSVRCCKVIS